MLTIQSSRIPMLYHRNLKMAKSMSIGLVLAWITLFTPVASAQTRFEWPDSRIDVTKHQFLEPCLAVSDRVKDSVVARGAVRVDTLHFTLYGPTTPLPANVVESAQHCLARFSRDQIAVKDIIFAQRLYLIAGQDSNAIAVVQRYLGTIAPTDSAQRAAVLDTIVTTYLGAQAPRYALAKPWVDQLTGMLKLLPFARRLSVYGRMFYVSELNKDTVAMQTYGTAALAVASTVFAEERSSVDVIAAKMLTQAVNFKLHRSELMDSLRRSTTAMRSLQDYLYEKTMGIPLEAKAGKPAARITGDYWFPQSSQSEVFPRSHRVTLVGTVRVDPDISGTAMRVYVVLQRLMKRFPDMDVVLVGKTQGYFGAAEPPDPDKEAEYINTLFRVFRKLPVTLSVSKTPFWRLPDLDRRRINEAIGNEEFYAETTLGLNHGVVYLVDEHGLVVGNYTLGRESEEYLEEAIGIVLDRAKRGS